MPNFEERPNPPREEPEEELPKTETDSKQEQAEGVLMRLNTRLRGMKDAILASMILGQIASSGLDLVKAAYEEQERARAAAKEPRKDADAEKEVARPETEIRQEELLALDPEASPERVRFILDTLPESFVDGEVASIGFTDEKFEMHESYGAELQESQGAGTAAGGTRAERTVITFWKGMKGHPSEQIWNGTLLHEVAHANDWDTDDQMEPAERTELKANVVARVQSEDRYRSPYVEAISNPDAAKELDIKAKEYWGEIVEAYLKGEALPTDDEALVKGFIAKSDPAFDRDAALAKRKDAIAQMGESAARKEFESAPEKERQEALAWVERHEGKAAVPELEAAGQRLGRRELVKVMRALGTSEDRQAIIQTVLDSYLARESLLEARKHPEDRRRNAEALRQAGRAAKAMAELREEADEEELRIMDEIAAVVDGHDLALGEHRGARMELGERAELFPEGPMSDGNEWIVYATDWDLGPAEYDIEGPGLIVRHFEYEEEDKERGEDASH